MRLTRLELLRLLPTAIFCAAGPFLGASCATTPEPAKSSHASVDALSPDESEAESELPIEVHGAYVGEIVRVNAADRYVVVRCRRLPREGEEARVERGQWQKGRIRFTQPMRAPFATADIVRGEIDPGDQVLR